MASENDAIAVTGAVPAGQAESERAGMDRRGFLKTLGAAGACALTAGHAAAAPAGPDEEPCGVLVDTTRCAGCRTCERVCAEAHGLPAPDESDDVMKVVRSPSERALTVVNRYETRAGEVFVKRQCMHCLLPACASACLTRAMFKTPEGPVVWREKKCMGCRFCMVSCPFEVPRFEYHSPVPRIVKCSLCWDRLKAGQRPACVENCPAEALVFGKRSQLLEEAQRRIQGSPETYVHQIYGEREVGGTSYLYLAAVPFDQLGFRADLGDTAYPLLTREFLYGVPVVLTLLPALLLAISNATKENQDPSHHEATHGRLDAHTGNRA